MKIVVRKGVFETNSSSCHSVVIVPDSKRSKIAFTDWFVNGVENYINENGELEINLKDYGWKGAPVIGEYEKLCYLFTMFMNNEKEKGKLERYLRKHYDFNVLVFNGEDCYVDHQSVYDNVGDFLEANDCGRKLGDFLRDDSRVILIRNDNEWCEDERYSF